MTEASSGAPAPGAPPPSAPVVADSNGSTSTLSLRERLRLKAQQKLNEQAATSASTSRGPPASSSAPASFEDDDEEVLGSLTLGRTKRQAALKRPATYSIDPTDDATRLQRHPNTLASPASRYAASAKKHKGVDGMLREMQRRIKRGTDADGFSRAEEIARSMEQERLGRMGIAYSDEDELDDFRIPSSSKPNAAAARQRTKGAFDPAQVTGSSGLRTNGTAPEPTVRALSPTIPSFLWSSQSELAISDDENDRHYPAESKPDAGQRGLEASLAAVGADEDTSRQTLDLLQRDMRDEAIQLSLPHGGHIPFYRPGKTLAPVIEAFCEVPCLGMGDRDAEADAATEATRERIWKATYPHILMAGAIPPSLKVRSDELGRIVTWTAMTSLLERDVLQSQLAFALLASLVLRPKESAYRKTLPNAAAKAVSEILGVIPRLLNRIGVNEGVLVECFPDHADATDGAFFVVMHAKPRTHDRATSVGESVKGSQSRRTPRSPLYLTQAERDELLSNLARVVELVVQVGGTVVEESVSLLAGWMTSMALACAAGTSVALQSDVARGIESVLAAADEAGVVHGLQEAVCRRLFTALEHESVVVRARVVEALPGGGRLVQAVRAWLGWIVLTEHLAQQTECVVATAVVEEGVPSSDPMEAEEEADAAAERVRRESTHWRQSRFVAWSLDLSLLARAVDCGDARSPFHVASHSEVEAAEADFARLIAGVQLLALVLRDLPLHLCSFSRDPRTPTKADPSGTRTDPMPRTLQLALAPYASLHPTLDEVRVQQVHSIVAKLNQLNSRIRDGRADVILRTLAKDLLHRTSLALEYQLALYHPASAPSFMQ